MGKKLWVACERGKKLSFSFIMEPRKMMRIIIRIRVWEVIRK